MNRWMDDWTFREAKAKNGTLPAIIEGAAVAVATIGQLLGGLALAWAAIIGAIAIPALTLRWVLGMM